MTFERNAGWREEESDEEILQSLSDLCADLQRVERVAEVSPLLFYEPHPLQQRAHRDLRKLCFFGGANRLGKSWFLAAEIAWMVTGTHPWKARREIKKGQKRSIYLVGVKYEKMREHGAILDLLLSWFPKGNPLEPVLYWESDRHEVVFPNGWVVYCFSAKSDVSSLASGKPDLICVDEEIPYEHYQECVARARTQDAQILVGATSDPNLGITWIYTRIFRNVPDWRKPRNPGGSNPHIGIYTGSAWDNPHNDPKAIEAELALTDPEIAQARIYGNLVPMARLPLFLPSWLQAIEDRCRPASWQGECFYQTSEAAWLGKPEPADFQPDSYGPLRVWKWTVPDHYYVIGVDTAQGIGEDGDWSEAHVYDVLTGEQVAVFRSNTIGAEEFTDIIVGLAYHYNTAMIAPEIAKEGYTVMARLRMVHCYPNLYRGDDFDKESIKQLSKVGWFTNGTTKPLMIHALAGAVKERMVWIYDENTLNQMRVFGRDSGKMEAIKGMHDDAVIALAIPVYIARMGDHTTIQFQAPDSVVDMESALPLDIHPVLGADW